MASLMTRLRIIVQGKTNTVVTAMEDPEEALTVFAGQLDRELAGLHRAVSGAVADEKRLKQQIDELVSQSSDWERRAVLAVEAKNDDLARQALVRRGEIGEHLARVQQSWETQRQATTKLKANLVETKRRAEDAKRQYQLKVAEYRAAKATNRMTQTMHKETRGNAMEMMDALDRKIANLTAETETTLEMSGVYGNSDVEAAFRDLERGKMGSDALAELKARMAQQAQAPDAKASIG
jgi:phage shock protein A